MLYGWKEAGFFLEHQTEAADLAEAKKKIRAIIGAVRLPRGLEIWQAADRKVNHWKPVPVWFEEPVFPPRRA